MHVMEILKRQLIKKKKAVFLCGKMGRWRSTPKISLCWWWWWWLSLFARERETSRGIIPVIQRKKKEIAQSRNCWQPLIPFIRAGKYFSPMFKRRERLAIAKSDENNFQR